MLRAGCLYGIFYKPLIFDAGLPMDDANYIAWRIYVVLRISLNAWTAKIDEYIY